MDPFVDQNDIVLLDVHYSTRTMVKFRTDVVFGILDLIAAFGGRKEHREQFFCFLSLDCLFRNCWIISRMFNTNLGGNNISHLFLNNFKTQEEIEIKRQTKINHESMTKCCHQFN